MRPKPYQPGLVPVPSSLRPHCLARDRLRLWVPLQARTRGKTSLTEADLGRIFEVIAGAAWAQTTLETYGSGLLLFHVVCDNKGIPEEERAPADAQLVSAFLATLAGSYSAKTLRNYIYGVKAWHLLHGLVWAMNNEEIEAILKAAETLAPAASRRKKRPPITVAMLLAIREKLDLSKNLDAATWACATTVFWGVARVGEFTVPNLAAFDPTLHVTRSAVREVADRAGLKETVFAVPRTKTAPNGEDVYWARQEGGTDPEQAFNMHLAVNNPPLTSALFAYKHDGALRPLTKSAFLARLKKAAKEAGLQPIQGHSLRIGGTLEYLLRKVPFDVVKAKGRWASDAFTLYLREHAEIMASYMQAVPELHDAYIRYAMPPVR